MVGISVQVTVAFVVLVGHLPQSDANTLYRVEEQSGKTGLQVNVSSLEPKLATLMCKLFGGGKGPASVNTYYTLKLVVLSKFSVLGIATCC